MDNLLSCRLASYGKYQDHAFEHLQSIGVKHVEINAPAPAEAADLKARLADHGLTAASVSAPCPVKEPDLAERFKPVFEAANILGADIVFVSANAGETPLDNAHARLRAVGEAAQAARVTVALETHPDLCDNGAKMVETMRAIDHPGVGINFDTANVHYYNEGVDEVAELKTALDHVVAMHLKDTSGEFKTWNFPALGKGVVDFPAVFKLLNDRGFHGPFTMELEGIEGWEPTAEERLAYVADSVAYLRESGLVP